MSRRKLKERRAHEGRSLAAKDRVSLMSSATLLDRFGGVSAVSHLVFGFYDRVTKSPAWRRISPAPTSHGNQTPNLSSLMGGPASFTDEQIRAFHARLNIDEAAFVEMLQILQATQRAALLDEDTVAEIVAGFAARRSVVIGRRSRSVSQSLWKWLWRGVGVKQVFSLGEVQDNALGDGERCYRIAFQPHKGNIKRCRANEDDLVAECGCVGR